MASKLSWSNVLLRLSTVIFFILILVLIILSAVTYATQWRLVANDERLLQLEVLAQALQFVHDDNGDNWPALPSSPAIMSNSDLCRQTCPVLDAVIPCYDIGRHLVPNYLSAIPQDSFLIGSNTDSGFYIVSHDSEILLGACYTFYNRKVEISISK